MACLLNLSDKSEKPKMRITANFCLQNKTQYVSILVGNVPSKLPVVSQIPPWTFCESNLKLNKFFVYSKYPSVAGEKLQWPRRQIQYFIWHFNEKLFHGTELIKGWSFICMSNCGFSWRFILKDLLAPNWNASSQKILEFAANIWQNDCTKL